MTTPRTHGGADGILYLESSEASEENTESVQILLVEFKLQNATQFPDFASYPEMYYLFDEFLRLFHESRLRVALRVLALTRLKTREDKSLAFGRTRLRRHLQFFNHGRSYRKSSWQLLLSRFEEVFPLHIDDQQRPLQTVALGDEVLQNLDDDKAFCRESRCDVFGGRNSPAEVCTLSMETDT